MYLKLFANGRSVPNSKIKIRDEATILDLKRRLGEILYIRGKNITIKFLETTLGDNGLLSKAVEKCLVFGEVPTSDEYHKTDLIVFNEDKLVGWLRVFEGGDSRQSIVPSMPRILCDSVRSAASLSNWSSYTVRDSKIQLVCKDAECSVEDNSIQSSSNSIQSSSNSIQSSSNSIKSSNISGSSGGSGSNADAASNPEDDPMGETGCRERCCPFDPSRPMYVQVMPENRQYGVVIETGACECPSEDRILHFLTEHLKVADEAKTLFFSICAPVIPLENALMIVGGDTDSRDWILRATRPICPPFIATPFTKYFDLSRYCFTIPMPAKWSFCRIFRIFEKQNCPLDTGTWVVVSQYTLDPCSKDFKSKAVDEAYPNMEVAVFIDCESAALVQRNCNKIDYLVWKLPFAPCGTVC
ncbi:hypothetical protein KR032_005022 [Drosophila birchii]|nr:hypothetical protein KR032_005022 [Drosophila birchii]